jgi:hypothetical protein
MRGGSSLLGYHQTNATAATATALGADLINGNQAYQSIAFNYLV